MTASLSANLIADDIAAEITSTVERALSGAITFVECGLLTKELWDQATALGLHAAVDAILQQQVAREMDDALSRM